MIRHILPLLLFCTLTAGAQQRIATVDMQKVFDGYHKTVQLTRKLEEDKTQFTEQHEELVTNLKAEQEGYKVLLESVEDRAISEAERTRRTLEAREKRERIQKMEQDVISFGESVTARLQETSNRMRRNLIDEIRKVVTAISRTGGHTLVLDIAATGINGTPIILYSAPESDLTQQVLDKLNEGQPRRSDSSPGK